jgi:transcription elongation factor
MGFLSRIATDSLLSPATVACVIKSDRESMRVLDQNASVRTILPSQVTNKIEARRTAVATDRNGSEIRVGDSIRETSGEMRTGTILHIHRSFLFCNNRTQIDHSGTLPLHLFNDRSDLSRNFRYPVCQCRYLGCERSACDKQRA